MIFSANPESICSYQSRTADMKPSMPNVWAIPRKVKRYWCWKHRTEATGRYTAKGNFKCVECCK